MQSKKKILELIDTKSIEIKSTNEEYPFNAEQVGSDSIDLRLGEYFYVMKEDYEYINTLNIDSSFCDKIFEKKALDIDGYILKPHEIIFAPTLEKVYMHSSRFYGYVSGRSYYARLGMSVNCTMTKFGYGMDSIVSLQIVNNTPVPLKIFPRQKIIQMEIHEIYGEMSPYAGQYSQEKLYILPKTKSGELTFYSENECNIIKKSIPKETRKKRIKSGYTRKLYNYFKTKNIITSVLGIGGFASFLTMFITNTASSSTSSSTTNNTHIYDVIFMVISLVFCADFIYSTVFLSNGVEVYDNE